MTGIGATLNIAKKAIAAQQYGLNVTGQNIANVNNPSYSRQVLPHTSSISIQYAGLLFGTGVDMQQIEQYSDQLLENRIMDQKSQMTSAGQAESYLKVLEGIFTEDSESSISFMMSEYFNAWHNLSDNPSGTAERVGVYENGLRLTQGLNSIDSQLSQLSTDLTMDIEASVEEVNRITKELAVVNNDIVRLETDRTANDLRDKRNELLGELSQHVNIDVFEQPSGAMIVTTANGFQMVNGPYSYDLAVEEGNVYWLGSYGNKADITDKLSGGGINGLLEVRDEVLPKLSDELDLFTREVIWNVNYAHSQGAGSNYYNAPMTSEYKTDDSGLFTTLDYGNRIDYDKDMRVWVSDTQDANTDYAPYDIDMGISSASVGNWRGTGTIDPVEASPYRYQLTVTTGGIVDEVESPFDPRITWEKVNLAGVILDSGTVGVNAGTFTIDDDPLVPGSGIQFDVGVGSLVEGNTLEINTSLDAEVEPLAFSATGTAGSVLDTYRFKVTEVGVYPDEVVGRIGYDPVTIEWDNGFTSGEFTIEPQNPPYTPLYVEVDGMRMEFSAGYVIEDDIFTMETDAGGQPINSGVPGNHPTDWHWTMESYADQYNRSVKGVEAHVTVDNRLNLSPETDGYEAVDFRATGGIDMEYTKVSFENYEAFKGVDSGIQLGRDADGMWTLSGIDDDHYVNAQIVPASVDLGLGGVATGLNETYTFEVVTGGDTAVDPVVLQWTDSQGNTGVGPIGGAFDGMTFGFPTGGTLYEGQTFTITTDGAGTPAIETNINDYGFGLDLTGDGGADMMFKFDTPIEAAGTMTFDIASDLGTYGYAFSDETSEDAGLMAALGLNTFFSGSSAMTIGVSEGMNNVSNIAVSRVDAGKRTGIKSDAQISVPITITAGSNDQIRFQEGDGSWVTATIDPSLTAATYTSDAELEVLANDIEAAMEDASMNRLDYEVIFHADTRQFEITQARADDETAFTVNWQNSSARTTLGFAEEDDTYTPPSDIIEGEYGSNDNGNGLIISDLQNTTVTVATRTHIRGMVPQSESIETSIDGYYRGMIGSLGTTSASTSRSKEFNETMVQKLGETRDSLSGVSLDEEMINLMKYQHAYSVAAKLLSTSDEMLTTLISMK